MIFLKNWTSWTIESTLSNVKWPAEANAVVRLPPIGTRKLAIWILETIVTNWNYDRICRRIHIANFFLVWLRDKRTTAWTSLAHLLLMKMLSKLLLINFSENFVRLFRVSATKTKTTNQIEHNFPKNKSIGKHPYWCIMSQQSCCRCSFACIKSIGQLHLKDII